LAKDLDADAKSLAMVKDIQSTASRASMLTAQLQTIGRSASLEPEVLDPVAVLQSNAEVLERILGDEIDLQWSLEDAGGAIRVDPGQFEQMILNLAINARDAMPDGGELRISVGPIEADRLRREPRGDADRDSGDFLVITVTDTGIGMDEETRAHCFDPFFTTKGPFKGTGLGLAAARRLVEGSGGVIRCQSKLGVGTNFEIIFPTTDEVVPETTSVAVAERPRGSATVLVAEDDDGLRQLMVRVLSRNGYQVLVAESGERALEVAGDYEGTIDLLVSDVVMLDVDGAELAAALQRTHPSLRVLMTSGTADASIVNHLTPGTAAFLAKPYRPSALIDQVHELLSRR
jgi:CheY-like chemotaxis protein